LQDPTSNSLHETNGKYENLNSMKSQLQYYHTKYCSCSYVVNCIYMNTSKQQIHTCKSHNKQIWNTKPSQYHITATPHYYHKNNLQLQI